MGLIKSRGLLRKIQTTVYTEGPGPLQVAEMTQAGYGAIVTPDDGTLYVLTDTKRVIYQGTAVADLKDIPAALGALSPVAYIGRGVAGDVITISLAGSAKDGYPPYTLSNPSMGEIVDNKLVVTYAEPIDNTVTYTVSDATGATVQSGIQIAISDAVEPAPAPAPLTFSGIDYSAVAEPGDTLLIRLDLATNGGVPPYAYVLPSRGRIVADVLALEYEGPLEETITFKVGDAADNLIDGYVYVTLVDKTAEPAPLEASTLGDFSAEASDGDIIAISLAGSAVGGTEPYTYSSPSRGEIQGDTLVITYSMPINEIITFTIADNNGQSVTSSIRVTLTSAVVTEPAPTISYMMAGAPTEDGFRVAVAAEEPAGDLRVAYSASADMSNPSYTTQASTNAANVAFCNVTGMPANTRIYYQAYHGGSLIGPVQSAETTQTPDQTLWFGFASCGRGTDSPVYQWIADRGPNFFVSLGDTPYVDHRLGAVSDATVPQIRTVFRDFLGSAWMQPLLSKTPWIYTWDDHDINGNNGGASTLDMPDVQQVYREMQPHYPLVDGAAIYHAYTIGAVRFITPDLRSERANGKIMSTVQMTWLKDELSTAANDPAIKLVIFASSVPWISSSGSDTWAGFAAERQEIGDHILALGLEKRLAMISGDAHMLAHDDGTNNTFNSKSVPSFPVFQSGPLDMTNTIKGGPYTTAPITDSQNQYSMMSVKPHATSDELVVWVGGYSGATDVTVYDAFFTTAPGEHMADPVGPSEPAQPSGTIVQSKIFETPTGLGNEINQLTMSFDGPTSAGNMLVWTVAPDKNSGGFFTSAGWVPAGWTPADTTTGNGEISAALFYRIADGSETDVAISWNTACNAAAQLIEIAGNFQPGALIGQGAEKAMTTSTSVALTTNEALPADALVLAWYLNDTKNSVHNATASATNGYTAEILGRTTSGTGDNYPTMIFAHKIETAGTTPATTISHTGSNEGRVGFMLAFDLSQSASTYALTYETDAVIWNGVPLPNDIVTSEGALVL